ncbi:hypothetical protein RND81_02G159000 [Saponaria officinalis]|uniref:Retrotransposon gag domain-containing protein n=1 Tax=Saponaria officinalis TaxID=3572 RepID=A0AAW1MN44_SAPOF
MVDGGEDKPWKGDMDAIKAEIGQISYVVKNIATMLARQQKKKMNESESDTNSESGDDERSKKDKKKEDDDKGLKLDIPEFNGDRDAEKFLDWIRQIERIFEYKDYDEHKKFKVATLKLTKYASLWYENMKRQRRRDRKPKVETWEKLKKHLTKRFLPRDYEHDNYLKLTSLSQENSSVSDYIHEFEKMSIVCDLEEKQELRTARFIRGLNPNLAQRVEIQSYSNFDDACRLALKFEKQDKSRKPYNRDYTKGPSSSSEPVATTSSSKETRKEDPDAVVEAKETRLRRYFKCQGYDHIANEYPQRRALTIQKLINLVPNFVAPEPNSKHIDVEDESDVEEVHEMEPYSNEEKEVLMLRNLCIEAAPIEAEQMEHLFHSRCKVNDQICTLIDDSGFCTNVITKDVVAKLKSPTKDHPKPHRLHWLDGNNGTMVKKQALISLQLGSYKDEILCDVTPLNDRPTVRDNLYLEANEANEVISPITKLTKKGEMLPCFMLPNSPTDCKIQNDETKEEGEFVTYIVDPMSDDDQLEIMARNLHLQAGPMEFISDSDHQESKEIEDGVKEVLNGELPVKDLTG